MRLALLGCALLIASWPVFAQSEKEAKKKPVPRETVVEKKKATKEPQPPKPQKARVQQQQNDPYMPQNQRARERTAADPPPDHRGHTARDPQPKGPPSKAAQMQRQQYEQRTGTGQLGDNPGQVVQCRARPVCGGAYGFCQEVVHTYTAASVGPSRADIVRRCEEANIPDNCSCVPQCERVARCSIF